MFELTCDNCGKWTGLSVTFVFEYSSKGCDKCHQWKYEKWQFYFCDLKCFFEWLEKNKVKERGVPCRDCRWTGYKGGFESNGTCPTCNGEKAIKKCEYGDF